MKKTPRLIWVLGIIFLAGVYVFPIWRITLVAPQYPEGLTMLIGVNSIYGTEPGTLQNYNLMNHYVGMQPIEAKSFKELIYMPFIIGFFIVLGIIGILTKQKWVLYGWLLLIVAAGVVGLADFYHWEYVYGHTLSPKAAIKIEGMAYQPPFIGSKQLLNFTAYSYPAFGGYLFGLATIAGFLATYFQIFKNKLK